MHPLPLSRFRFVAAALLLLAPAVRADIDLPTAPPPQPQPVTAKVFVGEAVEIPLTGFSRSGAGLKFLIRRQPSAGQLSEIRMTSPNTGIVTYLHDPAAGPGMDGFRYAASAPDRGISTPAEVVINVAERPAIFNAPARIDFPDTAVGETSTQVIEIRNDGGGLLEGKLAVPPPWKLVDDDGSYSLGAGGARMVTVAFTPDSARAFAATGQFSHAPDAEIGLGGGGFNPIEVAPREIRLESDGRSEVRTGTFVIRNVSLDDRELRIAAPPEVVVERTLKAAAQSEAQVALHTAAGFLKPLEGRITISGQGLAFDVPLHVAAAPPRLTVGPSALDFGTLESGRTGRLKVVVSNVGGTAANLTIKPPEGLEVSPFAGGIPLEPGASREFELRLARPLAGKFSEAISFEADQSRVVVPIHATIRSAASAPSGSGARRLPAAMKEAEYNDLPPVMEIAVTRQTRTELDLEWRRTSSNVARYLLFMRTLSRGAGGRVEMQVKELDRVKVRFVRDLARVSLAGLRPGESVTLCVVGMDANGVPSKPSPFFTVTTKPKPAFRLPWLAICIAALAALTVLIVRDRLRRRAALDRELEARIEQF